jgi:hypothetical protein
MEKRRGDAPDIAFGAFLILLAAIALFGTRSLTVGTAADMGPGYVPRALGWIILGFGVAIGVPGIWGAPRPLPGFKLRPLLSILVSLALFALLLPRAGLVLATLGTMTCSTFATPDYKWRESVLFAIVITTLTVLLFVNGLGLPLSVWPRW